MSTPRDEFVWETKGENGKRLYRIEDLDRFDEILREDNRVMWERIKRGWQKEIIEVWTPVQKKYETEPELRLVAKLPIDDVKRKFG